MIQLRAATAAARTLPRRKRNLALKKITFMTGTKLIEIAEGRGSLCGRTSGRIHERTVEN
ncbi:3-hydroxy-3-methylglutaryl-CoA reductase [Methylocaldum marinum]|uniref:3-hydroxy-3-methylglutaryl-CoA reductase n=1 Tax=Methylocaldum marinum TaxID=1432792 RepID=A0A250KN88_9GAMM|nr:3-hydroxy-3-methylglutaryl-CoA reductase [Methylocaldum marinum]